MLECPLIKPPPPQHQNVFIPLSLHPILKLFNENQGDYEWKFGGVV